MGFSKYYEGCLNSPLRNVIFSYLHEVLEYDVDLVYFDGPYQGMDHRMEFCHCDFCRAAYLKATGREIPDQGAPIDAIISCTTWINGVAKDMLEELANTVRSLRGLPVFYNNTSILNRGWCRSHAFSAADGFMFEGADTPEDKLFTLQLGKSTNKVVWSYVGYHSQYNREHLRDKSIRGWFSYPVDGDELLMDGDVAIASSVGLVFWSLSRLYAMPQPPEAYAEGRHVHEIFDLMQKCGSDLGAGQISPQCGVFVSSQTIEWCSADSYLPAAYQNGFHGIWRVMQELSFASEPFLDFDFDAAFSQRYSLIYVSNAACLSKMQSAMLASFVHGGGTLIATHLSGLYDEFGRTQTERPLHDLLGIRFLNDEPIEHPELYLRFSDTFPLIPQDPQIVQFQVDQDTKVIASTFDLAHRTILGPAITQRNYGSGRAIYIGSNLESVYEETRMPAVRDCILSLLEPHLKESRRDRIPENAGLMAHFTESPNVLFLHLIANTGNKVKKARVNESYLPLESVRVSIRIPEGKSVRSVRLLHADKTIPSSMSKRWISLDIDRIYIYEIVAVEIA